MTKIKGVLENHSVQYALGAAAALVTLSEPVAGVIVPAIMTAFVGAVVVGSVWVPVRYVVALLSQR